MDLTPEHTAHNALAPPAAQYRPCSHCGRIFCGPAWAGWRLDAQGTPYARTGMCSEACLAADLPPGYARPANALSIAELGTLREILQAIPSPAVLRLLARHVQARALQIEPRSDSTDGAEALLQVILDAEAHKTWLAMERAARPADAS
jgi:hypothetical protein